MDHDIESSSSQEPSADQQLDAALVNTIARVTGGNFRLVEPLFAHLERIVAMNGLAAVTTEPVVLARDRLSNQF